MPFVVSGLVAAGGLAAALSTADGLLLTISNALVHDMKARPGKQLNSPEGRVILSKFALLAVALLAAVVAAWKPAAILALVTASFSLAAAAFFPGMVLGILWKRAHRTGVVCGMLAGLAVTVAYMLINAPVLRVWWGTDLSSGLWFGIQPVSAGVFGVPVGFLVTALISLLFSPPNAKPITGSDEPLAGL
jgi:cation/acetate symporter